MPAPIACTQRSFGASSRDGRGQVERERGLGPGPHRARVVGELVVGVGEVVS